MNVEEVIKMLSTYPSNIDLELVITYVSEENEYRTHIAEPINMIFDEGKVKITTIINNRREL